VHSVSRCPLARVAKGGPCCAPGCDHIAGLRRRVCVCCLRKLGDSSQARYSLRLKFGSFESFLRFEEECLEKLRGAA
jgi:hypothetical protein